MRPILFSGAMRISCRVNTEKSPSIPSIAHYAYQIRIVEVPNKAYHRNEVKLVYWFRTLRSVNLTCLVHVSLPYECHSFPKMITLLFPRCVPKIIETPC
jgi:hypothetical protein